MLNLYKHWEFNVLGVYDYNRPGKFDGYYQFIRENHDKIAGDICEVGVHRGSSLVATAMLLKELGSDKIVWGFDSFFGFPEYHKNDELHMFTELFSNGSISKEMFLEAKKNEQYKYFVSKKHVTVGNISPCGNFSDTSYEFLLEKIDYLRLDNIRLVRGNFAETMTGEGEGPKQICASLIDCDLYLGYKDSLPYLWERLNDGGYIYLDEYYSLKFAGARIATDEFFANKNEKPQMHPLIEGDFERWFVTKG